MDKTERLEYIRKLARGRPKLTAKAAEFLTALREEEPDTPVKDVAGALPPEEVEYKRRVENEDESELNTETISPLMREAVDGRRERSLDAVESEELLAICT